MVRELAAAAREWIAMVPPWWRRGVIAAGVLVAVVAVVRGRSGDDSSTGQSGEDLPRRHAVQADLGSVMLRQDGAAVLGVMHTNDGVAAAALSYTGQRNRLLTGATSSAEAAEVGAKLALGGRDIGDRPASLPDRAADRNPEAMLAGRQGTLAWFTVPLAYRVLAYRSARATVRVFSADLNVAATAEQGPGAIAFALQDLTLVWSDHAWRIRSVADAADQPTPAFVAATDSDQAAAGRPIRDRVIRADQQDSAGLFAWLSDATAALTGPRAMGPVQNAERIPDGAPQNLVGAIAAGYAAASSRRATGSTSTWTAATPIAFRSSNCPDGADDDTRCFEVLSAAATVRGRGIAVVTLQLAGLAVSARRGATASVKFDLPAGRQSQVLGGLLRIASPDVPESRTANAAWQRSVAPLSPVYPARPR